MVYEYLKLSQKLMVIIQVTNEKRRPGYNDKITDLGFMFYVRKGLTLGSFNSGSSSVCFSYITANIYNIKWIHEQ